MPVETEESFCKKAMGLSLKNVRVDVEDTAKGKTVFSENGEMLFTHFGLSGPLILSGSAHMRPFEKDRFKIHIDLKPALDKKKLEKRIERVFREKSQPRFCKQVCRHCCPVSLFPLLWSFQTSLPTKRSIR